MEDPFLVVAKRPPGKKNTKTWCKGKVGREHKLVIAVPDNAYHHRPCGWYNQRFLLGEDETRYNCNHVELCEVCGKVMRRYYYWYKPAPGSMTPQECPHYTPQP